MTAATISGREKPAQYDKVADMRKPSLKELSLAFLRLGLTAFGGPAMVAHIKEVSVNRKDWMDEEPDGFYRFNTSDKLVHFYRKIDFRYSIRKFSDYKVLIGGTEHLIINRAHP